jgi:hypothetical protein
MDGFNESSGRLLRAGEGKRLLVYFSEMKINSSLN